MVGKLVGNAVSAALRIVLALTMFGIQRTELRYTTRYVSNHISANLELFFEETLQGCTIQTVLDGRRSYSEDTLVTLSSRPNSFKTFIAEKLEEFEKSDLYSIDTGLYISFDSYKAPQWLFKRHTFCSAHLYVSQEDRDLVPAFCPLGPNERESWLRDYLGLERVS